MESKNLRKLLDEYEEIDIIEMLKNFKSIRTSGIKNDIEVFLQEKAIKFEKSSISSTYIVFSKNNEILGYFTIANRSLVIPKENFEVLSKTQQKKLGNSAAILRNGDLMTSSFLLGQLGKNYSDGVKNLKLPFLSPQFNFYCIHLYYITSDNFFNLNFLKLD